MSIWLATLLAAASPSPTLVHVLESGAGRPVTRGLTLELAREATFVETATRAAVRVRVSADGRALTVQDAEGQPLVSRQVRAPGPAATRIFVALSAQAVRRHRAAAAESPAPRDPPPAPSEPVAPDPIAADPPPAEAEPPASEARRAPPEADPPEAEAPPPAPPPTSLAPGSPAPPPTAEDAPLPQSRTSTAAWRLEALAAGRLWTDPVTPRWGLDVAVARALGPVHVGVRAHGAYGPALESEELSGQLAAVHALAELSVDLGGRSLGLTAGLGAGLGLLVGSARARTPTFADPGTRRALRLWEPVLWPRLAFTTSLTEDLSLVAAVGLKVALQVHTVNLPGTFASTEDPLVTPRLQPGLSFGLRFEPGIQKD